MDGRLPEFPDDLDWRVGGQGRLRYRCWDGEYVVFNPSSGSTHLIGIVAGEVLIGILAGPVSTRVLGERLADFLEVENDAKLRANLDTILGELDQLGLIEPAHEC